MAERYALAVNIVQDFERPPIPERTPGAVKSAARVLDILELLAVASTPLGVSEVARRLGMPKSSAHMLLATLEQRGYVIDHPDRRFALHPAFISPGSTWVGGFSGPLLRIARSVMHRLVAATGESALLARLREDLSIEYIEKVVSPQPVRVDVELGVPRPVDSTSSGQVLLAFASAESGDRLLAHAFAGLDPKRRQILVETLAQVRVRGFAMVSHASSTYSFGVAAPIRDGTGNVVAALNVTAPSARFHQASDRVTREVVLCAATISRELSGYSTMPPSGGQHVSNA